MSNLNKEFTRDVSPHEPPKARWGCVSEGRRRNQAESPPGEKLQLNDNILYERA